MEGKWCLGGGDSMAASLWHGGACGGGDRACVEAAQSVSGPLESNHVLLFHTCLQGPEPSTGTLANAWIAGLKKTQFNGCGHVRLQLDVLTSKDYSIATTNAADGKIRTCATASIDITNAGCISAKAIAEQIIEKYFR